MSTRTRRWRAPTVSARSSRWRSCATANSSGVGVAALLYSLFEEQLREAAERHARLVDEPAESFPEALDYVPAIVKEDAGHHRYLSLVERAAAAVDVPVIASLNGVTPEGWTDYARAMQDAGAAAIELNIYHLPGDPHVSGHDVEQRHIDVLERVKAVVTVPVAVKLSPYFSSTGEMALRLDEAGADALVLFNRFLQPDINPEELAFSPTVALSSTADGRLPRTWIALLRGKIRAALAAPEASTAPPTSPIPARRRRRRDDRLSATATRTRVREHAARRALQLERKGFNSVHDLRGMLSAPPGAHDAEHERAGYVSALRAANARAHGPWRA